MSFILIKNTHFYIIIKYKITHKYNKIVFKTEVSKIITDYSNNIEVI